MPLLFLLIFIFCFYSASAQEYIPRPHCGTHQLITKDLKNFPSGQTVQARSELSHQFLSPSKRFLIHYDISGINSVPLKDDNGNSIPDYVDSAAAYCEYAYQVEVTEMGYRPPLKDTVEGDAYDVYLVDNIEGNYTYGIATSDYRIGKTDPEIYTSYITVDNDFSSRDSVEFDKGKQRAFYDTSYNALKVVIAHEFHHMIQFAYSYIVGNPLIPEMTSTWMEYRVYPELRVYEEFLPSLFENLSQFIFSDLNSATGYRYAIFGQYIHAHYGDSLLKRMWELIGSNKSSNSSYLYNFLDSAFKERGSALADEWCEFLPWMYFTGSRAEDNRFFKNAALFPEVRFFYDSVFTKPSTTTSGFLSPYELRFLRVILPESVNGASVTADIALANIDTKALVERTDKRLNYAITITQSFEAGFKSIPGTPYFIQIEHNENICDTIFVSGAIQSVENAFPNPFKPRTDREAFFPAPPEAVVAGRARLTVFKSSMESAYSAILPVEITDQRFALRWTDVPESLSSGVYIYSVEANGIISLGKIVIQR